MIVRSIELTDTIIIDIKRILMFLIMTNYRWSRRFHLKSKRSLFVVCVPYRCRRCGRSHKASTKPPGSSQMIADVAPMTAGTATPHTTNPQPLPSPEYYRSDGIAAEIQAGTRSRYIHTLWWTDAPIDRDKRKIDDTCTFHPSPPVVSIPSQWL